MHKLLSKLRRPFKRSSKTLSEDRKRSGAVSETAGGASLVQAQKTVREKHGLFELVSVPSDDDFTVDIVAVHGLSGDWESTWTDPKSKSLWLRDFLPLQFPDLKLRIWSFGYDSATAFTSSVANIDDAAKALINALDGERQTTKSRKKPIVFIAHSLGGIIVKRAINLANERSELWKNVVDSVISIIFFAVPHRGADVASLATAAANIYSVATFGLAGNKSFVEALKRNSPEFWQISNAFIQPASKVRIIRSFYETTKIGNKLIVDEDSASLGLNNERAIPIQGTNHREICKFFSDASQKYKPVRNAMQEIVAAVSSIQYTGNDDDAFLDFLCSRRMLAGLKYKRDSESRHWLYCHPTFQDWSRNRKSASHSRLLWVTGTPGSGKSTAMRGAYHRFLQEQDVVEGTHHVGAFFFERNEEPLLRNSKGMYRSLLHQILSRQRRMLGVLIKERVSSSSESRGQSSHQHSEQDYRALLLDVLKESCSVSQRITILIDALDEDESVYDDRDERDKFLHDIVTSDKFENLNVCLSSRHFGAVRWRWLSPRNIVESMDKHFKLRTPVIEVEVENHNAIRTYLDERLHIYSSETAKLIAIKEEIQKVSSGIFLWVEEIVDRLVEDLRVHGLRRLELRLKSPPLRLFHLYRGILDGAEDSEKTWRFFQWLLMAPELSLRAWRDLIPFLQHKGPRTLKASRNSEDWAFGLSNSREDDSWIPHLQQIICRISLGLAEVARAPERNSKVPAGDRPSTAGEAGSWWTADGDMWLVRPVHESLRQFLQMERGFDALRNRTEDHYGEGLVMAMNTCLDFIAAREFSRLRVFPAESMEIPGSGESTASLLSDGDASARTTASYLSSARSMTYGPHRNMSYSMVSNESLSTEDFDLDGRDVQVTGVLAHLNRDADRSPRYSQDKGQWIQSWRNSVESDGHIPSPPRSSVAPSCQQSEQRLRWGIWSSEFLTYVVTAFPKFAQSSEKAGIDSSLIVVRLREGGLWERWLVLSGQIPTETTLKQWAESERLLTWVSYLSRTRENPYTLQSVCITRKLGRCSLVDHDMNINYCFDLGDRFVEQVDSLPRPKPPSLSVATPRSLSSRLRLQLWEALRRCPQTYRAAHFVPFRSLREILTETVVADLLKNETKLAPKRAGEVWESYIRVLGILILCREVSYIKVLVKAAINDACLPLTFSERSHEILSSMSQLTSKDRSIPKGIPPVLLHEIEDRQWCFLSPFLARPAGQLQHYKLGSLSVPMPITSRRRRDWDRFRPGNEVADAQEEVQLHHQSFDFGDYGVQPETPESRGWFILRSLRGATWKRFLSIVYASQLVSEREDHMQGPGILPLLCTCEYPNIRDPSKAEYHLIFPLPRGNLKDLCLVDPTQQKWSGQLTERWLVSQCSRMAATLSAVHHVAALKMPQLPRFHFLRSGRLAADMIYWMSSSESQLGSLVIANLCQDPPSPHESAPEYFYGSNRPSHLPYTDPERNGSILSRKSSEINLDTPAQHGLEIREFDMLNSTGCAVTDRHSTTLREAPSALSKHGTPEETPIDPSIMLAGKSHNRGRRDGVSASKFHVWCLATIWLELVTWFVLGPQGMHNPEVATIFEQSSRRPSGSGFFEEMRTRNVGTNNPIELYKVKEAVVDLIDKLQRHKSCTVSIRKILKVLRERMLVVDAPLRASSQEVKEKMEEIMRDLGVSENTVEAMVAS